MKKLLVSLIFSAIFLTCKKEDETLPVENLKGKILYLQSDEAVFAQNLPDGSPQKIARYAYNIRWSNRGDKIAFRDLENLYILDAATFDTLLKWPYTFDIGGIAWSPDDSEIAITLFNSVKIRRMNLEAFAISEISVPSDHIVSGNLDWSGVADAFVFRTRSADVGDGRICTIRTDGSDFKVLASGSYFDDPRFSPDGKTIAFDEVLPIRTYLIDAAGGEKKLFLNDCENPCWSADGSVIMTSRVFLGWTSSTSEIIAKEVGSKQRVGMVRANYAFLMDWHPK